MKVAKLDTACKRNLSKSTIIFISEAICAKAGFYVHNYMIYKYLRIYKVP
jgi:hypothetical protein